MDQIRLGNTKQLDLLFLLTNISVTSPNSMAFSIKGVNTAGAIGTGTEVDGTCNTDWISIPCATNTLSPTLQNPSGVCVDRICGMLFNSVATTTTGSAAPVNSKYHSCSSNFTIRLCLLM